MVERYLLVSIRVWAGNSKHTHPRPRWSVKVRGVGKVRCLGSYSPRPKGMKGGSSSRNLNRESYVEEPLHQGGVRVWRLHTPPPSSTSPDLQMGSLLPKLY